MDEERLEAIRVGIRGQQDKERRATRFRLGLLEPMEVDDALLVALAC